MQRIYVKSIFLLDVPHWLFAIWPGQKRVETLCGGIEPQEDISPGHTYCQRAECPTNSLE